MVQESCGVLLGCITVIAKPIRFIYTLDRATNAMANLDPSRASESSASHGASPRQNA